MNKSTLYDALFAVIYFLPSELPQPSNPRFSGMQWVTGIQTLKHLASALALDCSRTTELIHQWRLWKHPLPKDLKILLSVQSSLAELMSAYSLPDRQRCMTWPRASHSARDTVVFNTCDKSIGSTLKNSGPANPSISAGPEKRELAAESTACPQLVP